MLQKTGVLLTQVAPDNLYKKMAVQKATGGNGTKENMRLAIRQQTRQAGSSTTLITRRSVSNIGEDTGQVGVLKVLT